MAERRVSVRLAAVGGKELKAELLGVGEAGQNAFGGLERAADRAGSRVERMGASSSNAGYRMQQLGFQVQDVIVSLQAGQNPLTVFIQQGSQIAQIYGGQNGGVGQALRDLGGMLGFVVRRFGLVGLAIAAGGAAVEGMRRSIAATTGVGVTFGDTMLGVWQVVRDGIADVLRPAVEAIAPIFSTVFDAAWRSVRYVLNNIINGFRISVEAIKTAVGSIPAMFDAAMAGMKEIVFAALRDVLTGFESMVNSVAQGLNAVFGTSIGTYVSSGVAFAETERFFAMRDRLAAEASLSRDWSRFAADAGAIARSDPLGEFFGAVGDRAVDNANARAAVATPGGAGAAARKEAEETLAALERIGAALQDYAADAIDWSDEIGEALVGAFRGAEDAVRDFVRTGKLDFRELATSIIADLAAIAARRFIFGPIAGLLGGAIGNAGGVLAGLFHSGGVVGEGGPLRLAPATAFVGAQRYHSGGLIGPDEVPAILQRGERVLTRRQNRDWERGGGGDTFVFNVRDAESFRQSRAQVASDVARAVAAGRRAS